MRVTGGRLAAVAIGIPIVLCAVGYGAVSAAGTFARASEHHVVSYPWSGGTISLDVGSGSVQVSVGGSDSVGVAYTEHYGLKKPTVTGAVSASGLALNGRCPNSFFGSNCAVNYVLTVPASARLVVHGGDGSISVTDLTGGVSLSTGNGSISIDGVGGDVAAHSGNGSIHGTDVTARSLQASSGNGSVVVAWTTAPTTVIATSGNGSVHLTVPRGSGPYQVQADTGNGSRHVDVPLDSSSTSTISAHTGNGSLTIDTAG
jgi:hypothetical protein